MKKKCIPVEEEQTSADLTLQLLVYRKCVMNSGSSNNSYEQRFKDLIDVLLWKYTEAHGKYIGCKYWSAGALKSLQIYNNKIVTSNRVDPVYALRQEHIYPKNESIQRLLNLETPTIGLVNEILKLNIGVVVTVEENSRLSKHGNLNDPWQRYRDANVEWHEQW